MAHAAKNETAAFGLLEHSMKRLTAPGSGSYDERQARFDDARVYAARRHVRDRNIGRMRHAPRIQGAFLPRLPSIVARMHFPEGKEIAMTVKPSVVFAEPVRTAIGAFGGSLKEVPAPKLGAEAIRAAITRAKLTPG